MRFFIQGIFLKDDWFLESGPSEGLCAWYAFAGKFPGSSLIIRGDFKGWVADGLGLKERGSFRKGRCFLGLKKRRK